MSDDTINITVGAVDAKIVTSHDLVATTGIATSRRVDSGAGLTGGGDLSADRTLAVGANGDGSIVVNANDVQVGVLATDAQHGNRGGGSTHPAAVSSGAAGFMTGADKAALDKLADLSTRPFNLVKDGGAIPNVNSAPAMSANDAAFTAAMARGGAIYIPAGDYYTSKSIDVDNTVWIYGDGGSPRGASGKGATTIVPPRGMCGLIVHRPATSAAGGRGDGSILQGFCIKPTPTPAWTSGAKSLDAVVCATSAKLDKRGVVYVCTIAGTAGGSEPSWNTTIGATTIDGSVTWIARRASGFLLFARASLQECAARECGTHGFEIYGNSSGPEGDTNTNNWQAYGLVAILNRADGIFVDGTDANVGRAVCADLSENERHGFWDSSFLGNTWDTIHAASNGASWCRVDDLNARVTLVNCYSEENDVQASLPSNGRVVVMGGLNSGFDSGSRPLGFFETFQFPFRVRSGGGLTVAWGDPTNPIAAVLTSTVGGGSVLQWRYADGIWDFAEGGLDDRAPFGIASADNGLGITAGTAWMKRPIFLGKADGYGGAAHFFATRLIPSDSSVPVQTYATGSVAMNIGMDNTIICWKCTAGGSPGTWIALKAGT